MHDKKYLLDGKPVSVRELVAEAEKVDPAFSMDWLKTTSQAAHSLRLHGHTVGDNPDWRPDEG